MERKRLWARDHPPSSAQQERNNEHRQRRTELCREAGLIDNRLSKRAIAWRDGGLDLLWMVRIAVPFSYAASKNHIYARRRSGHVALRRESKAKRREITSTLKLSLTGRRLAHNKLWIDILVQKPNHKGDAINVIDLVCDAIKDAVPMDDRWFSIRCLDWEVVKENPMLYIGVGQESDRDCQICSHCGRIKELSQFTKARSNPLGVGRACKECLRKGRLLKKGMEAACCAGCGREVIRSLGDPADAYCERCISHDATHAFPEEIDRRSDLPDDFDPREEDEDWVDP